MKIRIKYLLTLLLIIFCAYCSYCVPTEINIDSLEQKVTTVKDAERINILLTLARYYDNIDPERTIYFSKLALKTQNRLGIFSEKSTAFNLIGNGYRTLGNNIEALNFYQKALSASKRYNNQKEEAASLNNMGTVYRLFGDYIKSLEFHLQALSLYQNIKYQSGIAQSLNKCGIAYKNMGQSTKAIDCYNQALILSKKIKNETEEGYSLLNIGNIYWSSNMYNLALEYYLKSLMIYKRKKNYKEVASLLNNIGNVYRDRGNVNEALKKFYSSLYLSYETKDNNQLAVTYKNIGKTFSLLNMSDTAIFYYTRSLNIASENYLLRFVQEDYLLLSEIYLKMGNKDKTITYLMLYNQIRDKILHEERSQNITDLQYKFNIDQKENEIRDLKYHKSQLILNTIFIIALIFAVLVIILYSLYNNKRSNAIILQKEINERKITEQLLSESRKKFRDLADLLPEAIYETNENGIFTYTNNTWFTLFGYTVEEMEKGMQVFIMIAEEDKIKAIQNRQNTLQENKPRKHEYRAIKKDGTVFPVIIHINPINKNGKAIGTRGIVIDISAQKFQEKEQTLLLEQTKILNADLLKSQKELQSALNLTLNLNEKIQNSETNMKAIFNGLSQAIVLINKDYKIISYNNTTIELIHIISNKVITEFENILNFIPPLYIDTFKEKINAAFKGEIITEEKPYTSETIELWLEMNYKPIYDKNNKITGIIISAKDITEIKQTELTLKESENNFRSIVELAVDGIFLGDDKGNFIGVNSSASKITGYTEAELLTMNMKNLYSEKVLAEKPLRYDLLLKGESVFTERELTRKDGTTTSIEMNTKRMPQGIYQAFIRDVSERKNAEKALLESQRTLATMISNTPGMIYRCKNDSEWTMEILSENCFSLTGYKTEDLINNNKLSYNDIICPEDRTYVNQNVQREIDRKAPFRLTYRIITASGKIKWVWEQGCGIFDNTGELMALEGLILDITEQKVSEELLSKNEQRLQMALDAANEGLWDFNVDKNEMDYLSPKFFTMLGYEPNEFAVSFEKMISLIYPSDVEKFQRHLKNYIRKKTKSLHIEFRMITKNGNHIWILSKGKAIAWDELQNITRLIGTHTDISERKNFEEHLIENELKFRAAFENVNYGKIIVGKDKKILQCNKAFCNILGYTSDDLLGKTFDDITHPEDIDHSDVIYKDLINGKKSYVQFQKHYLKKNGDIISVNLDISLVRNINGDPLYFITHVQDITEADKTAKILIRSEEKYRQLAEQTSDIIWTMDMKMNLTYLNPVIKKHLGYTVEEYLMLPIEKKFPRNAIKITNDIIEAELLKIKNGIIPVKNYAVVYELQHYHKNGSIMWGEVSFTFLFNEENIVSGIQGTTRNITERKHIEDAMRKSEEQLKFALEAANDGLWDFNPSTNTVNYLSPRWYTLLKFEPYEFPMDFNRWINLIHDEDKETVRHAMKNEISDNTSTFSIEYRMQTKDGSYRWMLSHGKQMQTDEAGNITRMVGTHSDISGRKETEEALKASRQKYMELTEFLPQPIFEIDSNANFIFVNRQALLSFGYTKEDVQNGLNAVSCIVEKDKERAMSHIIEVLQGKSSIQNEYMFIKKDSTTFSGIVSSTPVFINNKIVGMRGIIFDITERKNIETELKQAKDKAEESDRLKSTFLANMSHEIRTPMNAILGFTELLKSTDLTEDKKMNFIDIISKRGKDLLNIINDIIDISKIESKQMKINRTQCLLNNVLQELYVFFENDINLREKKKLKLKLKTTLNNNSGFVLIDDMRLKQILTNLLSNSVKFTSTGIIEFGYTIDNNMLCFYVKDTGIGISKDKQAVIFDRFRQADDSTSRNYGGTGLGLAISKNLVEMMNGSISVESEMGQGSIFSFKLPYLPVSELIQYEQNKIVTNQKFVWSNKTILIVEDDKVNFLYLSTLLRKTKVQIIHAFNGKEAVEICRTNPSINLILMDIQMPEMNGYDATRAIKTFLPKTPIIAQTAYAMEEDRIKCEQAGCDEFIIKPIKIDVLINMIDKFI